MQGAHRRTGMAAFHNVACPGSAQEVWELEAWVLGEELVAKAMVAVEQVQELVHQMGSRRRHCSTAYHRRTS